MIFSFFVVRSDFMTWLFFIAKVNRISAKTNNKVSMYKLQFKNKFFFEGGGYFSCPLFNDRCLYQVDKLRRKSL